VTRLSGAFARARFPRPSDWGQRLTVRVAPERLVLVA
jgi:hypothetical protein